MNDNTEETTDLFGDWADNSQAEGLDQALQEGAANLEAQGAGDNPPPAGTEETPEQKLAREKATTEAQASEDALFNFEEEVVDKPNVTVPPVGETEEQKVARLAQESQQQQQTNTPPATVNDFTGTVEFLKSVGMMEFELADGETMSPEKAKELYEGHINGKVDSNVDTLLGDLPDSVKNFNKFVLDGGDPQAYLNAMMPQQGGVITKGMDLKSEANQIMLASQNFKDMGFDDETTAQQIEGLKAAGKLEAVATARYTKWDAEDNVRIQKVQEAHEDAKKNLATKSAEASANTQKYFTDNKEVYGIKFSDKEAKELPSYMTQATVELENGQRITPVYRDLYAALKDPNKFAVLAKFLNSDFDTESMMSNFDSKAALEFKNKLKETSHQSGASSQNAGLRGKM